MGTCVCMCLHDGHGCTHTYLAQARPALRRLSHNLRARISLAVRRKRLAESRRGAHARGLRLEVYPVQSAGEGGGAGRVHGDRPHR